MNKHQYLDTLRQELSRLGPAAVNEIIADFEDHFAGGLAHGKSEDEITAELGDPAEIARQYLEGVIDGTSVKNIGQAYRYQDPAQSPPTGEYRQASPSDPGSTQPKQNGTPATAKPGGKVNETALLTVILLNIILGIPIWIGLFATLFGCWATAGGIGVAAIVLFAVAVVQTGIVSIILALFGLSLAALTILAAILMYFLSKWLVLGLVKYIHWNKRLVMGGQIA
jgi:uncharacterized membrane protein